MKYKIINTVKSDLKFVYSLFEYAIEYQKRKNYPVWKGYDQKTLEKDVDNLLQYKIVEDEEILCVFSICYSDEIIWREKEKGDAMYLHRIVVNPKHKGQKQLAKIFDWSIELAKHRNLNYIRMDTWDHNPNLPEYYKSFGIKFVEYFKTSNISELPIQHRNLGLALLQFDVITADFWNSDLVKIEHRIPSVSEYQQLRQTTD